MLPNIVRMRASRLSSNSVDTSSPAMPWRVAGATAGYTIVYTRSAAPSDPMTADTGQRGIILGAVTLSAVALSNEEGRPLRILLVASEVVGFAKTGGLADVCGSLPQALARRGHEVAVLMPLYRSARGARMTPSPTDRVFWARVGDRNVGGRLWRSSLPNDVPVYLVEHNDYFDRDDPAQGRSIYQYAAPDGSKRDYDDNCERFTFLNRAAMEVLPLLDFFPEVLHVND